MNKRTIIILIITGMFVWAVYDLVSSNGSATTEEGDIETLSEDEDGTQDEENTEDESSDDVDEEETASNDGPHKTGLEKGNIAPDFELKTLDGEKMKLSDFRGQRVMLNFWATWCPPCRAEIPDMQKFYEDKDVEILAVNLYDTDNEDDISEFIDEFGMTFPVLLDEGSAVSTTYQIQPIPTTYLIDSNGRIHNMAFGALNYDLMVQEFEKMD
ncbi:MAG TPA: TlpA disulfide reductase family protein [Virgibacillus sp.]|nr:TlpA disulfide reductase family protein [Virgibacillus sp.]